MFELFIENVIYLFYVHNQKCILPNQFSFIDLFIWTELFLYFIS